MARVTKKIIYNDEESYTSQDGGQMFGNGEDKSASSSPLIQAQLLIGKIKEAAGQATNYLRYTPLGGLDVGFLKTKARVNIKGDGVRVYDEEGDERTRTDKDGLKVLREDEVISEFGETVTIGSKETGKKNIHIEDSDFQFRNGETILAKITPRSGYVGVTIGNDKDHLTVGRATSLASVGGIVNAGETNAASFDLLTRGIDTTAPEFRLQGCHLSVPDGDVYIGGNEIMGDFGSLIGESSSFNCVVGYGAYQNGNNTNIYGDAVNIYSKNSNLIHLRNSAGVHGDITITGSGTYAGTWTQSSDIRLKENIKEIDADEFLLDLKPIEYTRKDGNKGKFFGLSAQQVRDTLSRYGMDGYNTVQEDADGYLSIDYISLIPLLIHLCQSQQKEIDELKQEVKRNG